MHSLPAEWRIAGFCLFVSTKLFSNKPGNTVSTWEMMPRDLFGTKDPCFQISETDCELQYFYRKRVLETAPCQRTALALWGPCVAELNEHLTTSELIPYCLLPFLLNIFFPTTGTHYTTSQFINPDKKVLLLAYWVKGGYHKRTAGYYGLTVELLYTRDTVGSGRRGWMYTYTCTPDQLPKHSKMLQEQLQIRVFLRLT